VTAALGLDLGSVALKGTLLDRLGRVSKQLSTPLEGALAGCVRQLATELLEGLKGPVRLGVTGSGKKAFAGLAAAVLENDLVSSVRAVARLFPAAVGIIEMGGHQSKWMKVGPGGELESFSLNDQCAAGSGAFLEQQAGRMKMDVGQLAAMAAKAQGGASIAGRCAVFAKSDMIHQQQKGTPPAEIAYGLCLALARNFRSTLLRGRELSTPALFLGGGALNPGLYRAFLEVFGLTGEQLFEVDAPQFFASHGVALAALQNGSECAPQEVLDYASGFRARRSTGASGLAALSGVRAASRTEPGLPAAGPVEAYLGVDVGSVSTDLCLLSPEGEVLGSTYLRTRGDPVSVVGESLSLLREKVGDGLRVLGVGTTGSGRHLAGQLLGADVVKNEITCQLLGARHLFPSVDTIFEIGGQDSKYVSVRDGRLTDFVMNKVCAAGTGSFLEEQSETLGVSIEDEFARLALGSTNPTDLGSQCTVFMDNEVVGARQEGIGLPDILAGLAYSVARNYLERVVAGRRVGNEVVFQGGVASNQAVVAAFEQLLGKRVSVHPYNRISGAVGAALAAREHLNGAASRFRGLQALDSVDVRTVECKACSNMCRVSRIGLGQETAYFGDVCEKYTSRQTSDASSGLPDLFSEVEGLLESYAGGAGELGTAGLPRVLMMYDLFPFWATLLKSLGFRVVLSERSNMQLLEQGIKRLTAETCLPIKLAYGHVAALLEREQVDFVFLPSILDLLDCADEKSRLCPFEECVGYMVATFATGRVLIPAVSLTSSRHKLIQELFEKLGPYGLSEDRIGRGLEEAFLAQDEFRAKLRARGQEVLTSGLERAFVVLGKPYNTLDTFQNLNLAQHIRKLGVLPIPMQMLSLAPVDLQELDITLPWTYDRGVLQALLTMSRDTRLFPVVVSNFGCGPDAFALKHLEILARETPWQFLEFDEHRAEAGIITRLEAFVDEVGHFQAQRQPRPIPIEKAGSERRPKCERKRFVIPRFADHAWAYLGALRFAGHDAVMLPPPDAETLAFGESVSSGKECHPYSILAGDLAKHLAKGTIQDNDVYFFLGTTTPCLIHEWATAMRLVLERTGTRNIEVLSPAQNGQLEILGLPGLRRLARGVLACDLLGKLRCQVRPYAADAAQVDAIFEGAFPLLADAIVEDRVGEALQNVTRAVEAVERLEQPRRPLVGVAGDAYTRIHPFGNQHLFARLEELGLEVWPAPFIVDCVDFRLRRAMAENFSDGNYRESASSVMLYILKSMESIRVNYMLGTQIERASEPGYEEVLELAGRYLDQSANDIVLLNIAKMVDFVKRGADGVINAIAFHCMLGTVSASLTESIRRDHGMIPITTVVYSGQAGGDTGTKLEAFAHQVRAFAAARPRKEEPGSWFSRLWE
jgi:predicted CoA-substrate-specific enzyme activase